MLKKYRFHALIFLAGLSYSFLAVFTAALSKQGIDAYNQVFWRLTIASIIVFFVGKYVFKQKMIIDVKQFKYILVNSLLFVFGFSTFAASVYLGTPIAKAIALNYSYPITVVFLAYIFFKDKPNLKNIIAIFISILSVGLLLEVWKIQNVSEIHLGDLLAWINSFLYGSIIVWGTKIRKDTKLNPFVMLFYTLLTAIPGLLVLGTITRYFNLSFFNYSLRLNFSTISWFSLAGLCMMGTVLPYILIYSSVTKLKPLVTSILLLSEPLFVYLFGILFFNQYLSFWGLLGMLGIMVSVVLA